MKNNLVEAAQLKRSVVKNKVPQDLLYGEIAVNANSENPFLTIKDSAGNIIKLNDKPIASGDNVTLTDVLINGREHTSISASNYTIIESLTGTGKADVLYLYKQTDATTSAVTYTQYAYVDNAWVQVSSAEAIDINNYYTKTEVNTALAAKANTATTYTKTEVDTALANKADTSAVTEAITAAVSGKADTSSVYTKSEVDTALNAKQDTLVSGTNIKTINNESILGEGNIEIQGGGGKAVSGGTNISVTTGETADTINCTIPFKDENNSLLFGYNITLGTGRYYSLGISPKDSSSQAQTKIDGGNAIAIGTNVTISGGTNNRGLLSTAIGNSSKVYGVQSTALGVGCNASGNTTLAIGRYSTSKGNDSIAIGNQANVSGNSSIAIGNQANVSGNSSVAIGSGATANGVDYKMNLNNQIKVTPSNQVYISNSANTSTYCLQEKIENTESALGGLKLVKLTQSEYDGLATKDNSTLYVIVN